MKVEERQITIAPDIASVRIRRASPADVAGIHAVVEIHVREGHLLPRTMESIAADLADWMVADAGGQIVGCAMLLMFSPVLAEVRSLAVMPAYRGVRLGDQIVLGLLELARERRIPTVFALTRAVRFFTRLGFAITDKERFPQKVWKDCVVCPLFHACDETAVVFEPDLGE